MTDKAYGGVGNVDSFTIEKSDLGHIGGRYLSKSPLAAAKKVATQLFKLVKSEAVYKKFAGKTITFIIRKTTNNSNKKLYEYTAKQTKLQKPIEVVINGKTIQYKNKLTVKKKKSPATVTKKPAKKTYSAVLRKGKKGGMKGGGCNCSDDQ